MNVSAGISWSYPILHTTAQQPDTPAASSTHNIPWFWMLMQNTPSHAPSPSQFLSIKTWSTAGAGAGVCNIRYFFKVAFYKNANSFSENL